MCNELSLVSPNLPMLLKYYDSAFFNRSIIISDINLVAIYKIFLIRNDGLRMKVTFHKN